MRCFVAVELSVDTQAALFALQQKLVDLLESEGAGRVVRWTPPESIHLTLRFLGETSESQAAQVVAGLHAAARASAPLALALQGIGCFPSARRPNVVWAGVTGAPDTIERLCALQHAIELTARSAGFEAEERSFTPHLTLGRIRREASASDVRRVGGLLQRAAQAELVQAWSALLPVARISLMHSDLRPTGAVYTALERVSL